MGGTSTDVSHYAGEFERAFETQVAGVRMRAPMMSIHTVAAGGGSILHFDGARYRVGPDSAGANPGPGVLPPRRAADRHRRNVMLGKIQPRYFPQVFGPQRRRAARRARSSRAQFAALADEIAARPATTRAPEEVAEGFIDIAVGNMANAIKKISVQRGHDVTALHAVVLRRRRRPARLPGRRRARHDARVRPSAGRRAVGLRHGPGRPDRDARGGGRAAGSTSAHAGAAAQRSTRWPRRREASSQRQGVARGAHARAPARAPALRGHRLRAGRAVRRRRRRSRAAFEAAYRQRFAFLMPGKRAGRRGGVGRGDRRRRRAAETRAAAAPRAAPRRRRETRAHVRRRRAGTTRRSYVREDAAAGRRRSTGPAIIAEANATTVVEPGWRASVTRARPPGARARRAARGARARSARSVDPVMLEVFNNLFMSSPSRWACSCRTPPTR